MTCDTNYQILRRHVSSIDPKEVGSSEAFARVTVEINRRFANDQISLEEWRLLTDYLVSIQAR